MQVIHNFKLYKSTDFVPLSSILFHFSYKIVKLNIKNITMILISNRLIRHGLIYFSLVWCSTWTVCHFRSWINNTDSPSSPSSSAITNITIVNTTETTNIDTTDENEGTFIVARCVTVPRRASSNASRSDRRYCASPSCDELTSSINASRYNLAPHAFYISFAFIIIVLYIMHNKQRLQLWIVIITRALTNSLAQIFT